MPSSRCFCGCGRASAVDDRIRLYGPCQTYLLLRDIAFCEIALLSPKRSNFGRLATCPIQPQRHGGIPMDCEHIDFKRRSLRPSSPETPPDMWIADCRRNCG